MVYLPYLHDQYQLEVRFIKNLVIRCTDSRPRARWYQLRELPLVGSKCVLPQCNSSSVITRRSAKPSAFGRPVHLRRAHQKRKQKSGTPVTVNSPTVKCPMVRALRYSTLQKPNSGYQPQVGSDRAALIKHNCPYVGQ